MAKIARTPKFPSFAHPTDANLKNYVVILKKHSDLDAFYQDMETDGGSSTIPTRKVEVKQRFKLARYTHYWLTTAERDALLNDSRVESVTLTVEEEFGAWRDTWAWTQTSSRFSKAVESRGEDINWGLARSLSPTNYANWGSGGNHSITKTLTSELSGKNVDVVVMDDGPPFIQTLEWAENADGTGPSRMIQHNWNADGCTAFSYHASQGPDANRTPGTYTGITPVHNSVPTGTGLVVNVTVANDGDTGYQLSGNGAITIDQIGEGYNIGDSFTITDAQLGGGGGVDITITCNTTQTWEYIPLQEHGAHTTGTVAGNTQGWARDAFIHNLTFYDDPSEVLDFHNNKPINPATGVKNPTVMNNSWGFRLNPWWYYATTTTRIRHRGTDYYPIPAGGIPQGAYNPTGLTDATRPAAIADNILASSTSGSGTGAQFKFTVDSSGTASIETASDNGDGSKWGSGYAVNDTLTFNASLFGGNDDIVLTVTAVSDDGSSNALWATDTLNTVAMGTGSVPMRDAATDAAFTDLINAGVIVVASAGNSDFYQDVQGGPDWDNHFVSNTGVVRYYHRGSSPGNVLNVITVGAMGSHDEPEGESIYAATAVEQQDYKAEFSNFGPGVDVWAAGAGVQSVWNGNDSLYDDEPSPDPRSAALGYPNSVIVDNFKKCPGTSMSGPNVCGVLACLAEKYPRMTQADARQYIKDFCHETMQYTTNGVHTDDKDLGYQYNNDSCLRHMFLKNERQVETGGQSYPAATSIGRGQAAAGQKFPRKVTSVTKSNATFSLTASSSELKFGSPVTITLNTTNLKDGTKVPWYITTDYKGDGFLERGDSTGSYDVGFWDRGLWCVKDGNRDNNITWFGSTARGTRPSEYGRVWKIDCTNAGQPATIVEDTSYNRSLKTLPAEDWDVYRDYLDIDAGEWFGIGNWEVTMPWNLRIYGQDTDDQATHGIWNNTMYVRFGGMVNFNVGNTMYQKNLVNSDIPFFCFGADSVLDAWYIRHSTIGIAPNRTFVVMVELGTGSYTWVKHRYQLEFKESDRDTGIFYYIPLTQQELYNENRNQPFDGNQAHRGSAVSQMSGQVGTPMGQDLNGEFTVNNNTATYTIENFSTPCGVNHNAYFKLYQYGGPFVKLIQGKEAVWKFKITNHSGSGFTFHEEFLDEGPWPGKDRYWATGSSLSQQYRGWTTRIRVGDTLIFNNTLSGTKTINISDTKGGNVSGDVVNTAQDSYTFRPTNSGEYWMKMSSESAENSYQRILVDGLYKVQFTQGDVSNGYTSDGTDRRSTYTSTADKEIHIMVNDKLVIENNVSASHPVRISSFAGTNVLEHPEVTDNNQGAYTFEPTSPGKYYYNCTNHTGMEGVIIVSPPPQYYSSYQLSQTASNSTDGYASSSGTDRHGEVGDDNMSFWSDGNYWFNRTIRLHLLDQIQIQDLGHATDPVIISETSGGPMTRDVLSNWAGNRWFKPSKVQTYYYYSQNNPSTMGGTIEVTLP